MNIVSKAWKDAFGCCLSMTEKKKLQRKHGAHFKNERSGKNFGNSMEGTINSNAKDSSNHPPSQ